MIDARVLGRAATSWSRVLGQGGMAEVYLATDRVLNRRVAVKVLHAAVRRDASFVTRFRREAQAAAALNHPNVVAVYDTGSDDGTYFIVMEYVQGTTLAGVIAGEAPHRCPSRGDRHRDGRRRALAVAHAAGHRPPRHQAGEHHDRPARRREVMDFGIARAVRAESVTQTATVLGTATYFSPEQAQGQTVDARSDIYSLGVRALRDADGAAAVRGRDRGRGRLQARPRGRRCPPTRVDRGVPPALEAVVMRCLAKNPANRYQTADELAPDLERSTRGRTVPRRRCWPPRATQVVDPARRLGDAVLPPPAEPERGAELGDRSW